MVDRFFLPGEWSAGHTRELPEAEAQHAARVLRMQVGDVLEVFDGRGQAALARIASCSKRETNVLIEQILPASIGLACQITVAFAVPKGDRCKWLLEKLTELGVRRLVPLRTLRSVVDPRDSKLEKLEQQLIAACKQCRRNDLPELTEVHTLESLLQRINGDRLLVGEAAGMPWLQVSSQLQDAHAVTIVVGPEGGLTDEELTLLKQHGALPVMASPHILRIETAALALAALVVGSCGVASANY